MTPQARFSLTLALTVLIAACGDGRSPASAAPVTEAPGPASPVAPPDGRRGPESFATVHTEALQALDAAAAAGAEWLSTRDLLEEAVRQSERGDSEASMALARQAMQQAQLALEQSRREATAWRGRVVR